MIFKYNFWGSVIFVFRLEDFDLKRFINSFNWTTFLISSIATFPIVNLGIFLEIISSSFNSLINGSIYDAVTWNSIISRNICKLILSIS